MPLGRFVTGISLASLALLTAACGGGGGGGPISTPPPTPAPSPSPSPTPSPTTSPAPPSPPQGVNDDLLSPLSSETFVAQGALSTGVYNEQDDFVSQASDLSSVRIIFDASTGSYWVRQDGNVQQFTPADLVSEDGKSRSYLRESEGTKDALSLTKPGSTGNLTYRYVGAASWTRRVQADVQDQGRTIYFTYGAQTPSPAIPVSGTAAYQVQLIGESDRYMHTGSGSMAIDFANGSIALDLNTVIRSKDRIRSDMTGSLLGQGELGSFNSFRGDFSYDQISGGISYKDYVGTFSGAFFGPEAQELGAALVGRDCCEAIVGAIVGRQGGSYDKNLVLTNLVTDQEFYSYYSSGGFTEVLSTGMAKMASSGGGAAVDLKYNHASEGFSLHIAGEPDFVSSGMPEVSSDNRFRIYRGDDNHALKLFRPGAENPQIELSYASFGILEHKAEFLGTDEVGTERTYIYWGLPTLVLPRNATASYSGIVDGTAMSNANIYETGGTVDFTTNFTGLSGMLHLSGTNRFDGSRVEFGDFPILGYTTTQNDTNSISGTVDADRYNGAAWIHGAFYGYAAEEFAGNFGGIRIADPLSPSDQATIFGAFAGRAN